MTQAKLTLFLIKDPVLDFSNKSRGIGSVPEASSISRIFNLSLVNIPCPEAMSEFTGADNEESPGE